MPFDIMKAGLDIRDDFNPVSEVLGVFRNRCLSSTSGGVVNKDNSNRLYVLGRLLDSLGQELKKASHVWYWDYC